MNLIVLSPHLDDGIFSCGGRIAEVIDAGGQALVVTFLTGEPDLSEVPPSLQRFCDYSTRKEEDSRAAAVLGAQVQWLDFVEQAFRPPPLSGLSSVFRTFRTPEHEALDHLEAMQRVIVDLLASYPAAELLAPLAVGNHIDHVELFLAAVNALLSQQAFDRLHFYEDAYALGTRTRRQHFVTRRRGWSWREAPERQSLRASATFTALALARRGPPLERLLPPGAQALHWRYEVHPLAAVEARKLAAVSAYDSQVAMFGGADAWCDMLRRYHHCWGGGEPTWRAAPTAVKAESDPARAGGRA